LTTLGTALLPIWSEVVNQVNAGVTAIGAFVERNKGAIESFAMATVNNIRSVIAAIQEMAASPAAQAFGAMIGTAFRFVRDTITSTVEAIGYAYRNWADLTQIAGIKIYQFVADIKPRFLWLVEAAKEVAKWLKSEWLNLLKDALAGGMRLFTNYFNIIMDQFKELGKVLKDPTKIFEIDADKFDPRKLMARLFDFKGIEWKTKVLVLPELQLDHAATDKMIDDIMKQIGGREADRNAAAAGLVVGAGIGQVADQTFAAAKKKDEEVVAKDAAKVEKPKTTDLLEFAKLLGQGGFGPEKIAGEQLNTQKEIAQKQDQGNKLLGQIVGGLGRAGGVVAVAAPPG
jgi:hypothetical protein